MNTLLRLLVATGLALLPGLAAAGPVNTFLARGIMGDESPPPYGLRLDGFYDGDPDSVNTFSFDEVWFEVMEDGTARLHGQVELNAIGREGETGCCNYWIDVRLVPVPKDKRYCIVNYHREWDYYTIDPEGLEMWSQDNPSDSAHFWTYPKSWRKPFQVGIGANGKNDHYGAAGWLTFVHYIDGEVYGDRCVYLPSCDFLMDLDSPTSVASESETRPRYFEVGGNFPNPFNPATTLTYRLDRPATVRVEVFNALGAHVRTLVREHQAAGTQSVKWDGTDAAGRPAATGIYLYRITVDDEARTGKMLLLK